MKILSWSGITVTAGVCVAHVMAGYGGFVNPAISAIPSIVNLAFPITLAATVALLMFWLLLGKWKIAIAPLAALALAWPTMSVLSPLNFSKPRYNENEAKTKFRVMTYNILSFDADKYDGHEINPGMRYILDKDCDIVLLQEASLGSQSFDQHESIKPMLAELNKKYPYRMTGYHDQLILSKYPYKEYCDTVRFGFGSADDPDISYYFFMKQFDVEMPGHKLRIFDVHLKNIGLTEEDRELYREITNLDNVESRATASRVKHTLLSKLAVAYKKRAEQAAFVRKQLDAYDGNVLVFGDFNDTPGSWTYRTIKGSDMRDAWADCAFGPTITYHDSRLYFKIDQTLYRGSMKAVDIVRDKIGVSDHYPQVVTFVWKDRN